MTSYWCFLASCHICLFFPINLDAQPEIWSSSCLLEIKLLRHVCQENAWRANQEREKNTMVGVMVKVALKVYWNQRNAQNNCSIFLWSGVDSDWMTLLVLTFKTSSTLFLCSPSPNAASSTKMGSHIESYASISLCFILAYRASSLWTTFPTSHCKHTKSALLLRGTRSLPHSEGKGDLFLTLLLFLLTLAPEWDWKGRLWHWFLGALAFEKT